MKTNPINQIINIAFLLVLVALQGLAHAEVKVTYYIPDASGSPVAATDEQGNLKWRKHYRPFGEEIQAEPDQTNSKNNHIGYTGHVQDKNTGLTYMRARYYDPVVGRFMGMDPAAVRPEDPRTFNRYAYANNNPYKYTDPDGRNPVAGAAAGCAVTGPACPAGATVGAVLGTLIAVTGYVVYNEVNDGNSNGDLDDKADSGAEIDPSDKNKKLTKAGRALDKHGSRKGSAFPPATGNPDSKNKQGQEVLEDILTDPNSTTSKGNRFGENGEDVISSDGRGARFGEDGKFRGFLEP